MRRDICKVIRYSFGFKNSEPNIIYSKINNQRYEVRKIEIFKKGD